MIYNTCAVGIPLTRASELYEKHAANIECSAQWRMVLGGDLDLAVLPCRNELMPGARGGRPVLLAWKARSCPLDGPSPPACSHPRQPHCPSRRAYSPRPRQFASQ